MCRLLPRSRGLPRFPGGSASASSLSRPSQASRALRPAGLLNRPRRPLSRGSSPVSCPTKPLVSYRSNRQLSGWNPPPLVIRAVGAHWEIRDHAMPTTPTDQDGCARRLLPRLHGLPRNSGGSASATSLSRPAQASLALRPVGLLNRPRRPLSRGFGPVGCPSEPLVSYQRNRHLAGWNLPPLVNRAVWAHRVFRVDGRSLRPKARDRTNSSRPSRPTSAPARG